MKNAIVRRELDSHMLHRCGRNCVFVVVKLLVCVQVEDTRCLSYSPGGPRVLMCIWNTKE